MDFAPYQSESPDLSRQSLNLSRPLSPPQQQQQQRAIYSPVASPPPAPAPAHAPSYQPGGGWVGSRMGDRETVNQFETSLPIRCGSCGPESAGMDGWMGWVVWWITKDKADGWCEHVDSTGRP